MFTISPTIKQGDFVCEVTIYFGTKFKLSVDFTFIESYNGLGDLPYVTVIKDLWNSSLVCCVFDHLITTFAHAYYGYSLYMYFYLSKKY